jgi:hypothetical protein
MASSFELKLDLGSSWKFDNNAELAVGGSRVVTLGDDDRSCQQTQTIPAVDVTLRVRGFLTSVHVVVEALREGTPKTH